MKLLILLFFISCGAHEKKTNFESHQHLTGSLTIKDQIPFTFSTEKLEKEQVLRRFLTSSSKNPFNNPDLQVIKFKEKPEILTKENLFSFTLNLDQGSHLYDLYLWDQGVEEKIPSSQFILPREKFEKVINGNALLYIKYKFNLYRGDLVYDGEKATYIDSFLPPDSRKISLEEIFSAEESHQKEWFYRENPFGEIIFVYASLSDLKEEFFKLYQRKDFELRRINGVPQGKIPLGDSSYFFKVTASQEMNHTTRHGQASYKCRPRNIIISKSVRVPTSGEIAHNLQLGQGNVLREAYSHNSTEVWLSVHSYPKSALSLISPPGNTFFYETKCDRRQRKNVEAKLSLKVETYVEKDER